MTSADWRGSIGAGIDTVDRASAVRAAPAPGLTGLLPRMPAQRQRR
jgi:hypothetical protein